MKKIVLLSLLIISSCQSADKRVASSVSQKQHTSLAPVSVENQKRLQRDRAMVINKKNEMEGKIQTPLPNERERQIYDELVQAYERNDELSFQSRFQNMMTEHSRSLLADDALYLAGMMSFSNKMYGRAIKYFSQILTDYPDSNRARAALFAKASAYRKMNLLPQSTEVFKEVKTRYPGSPEAKRADVELRIIK